MLDLLAKTVWRIAFGDYDFAIDRKMLQYRLEETKTGTVWADGLPVGSVELEDRESGARTVYDFADATLVSLSEKAGAHGKRILFGLDLFGIPIDIYFTCAPREIQLTVEASRDTRAHRVQTVLLLPGLCAAPRQEGLTAHLVSPTGIVSADYSIPDRYKGETFSASVWGRGYREANMPFIGAMQSKDGKRTAIGIITDSAYALINRFQRSDDAPTSIHFSFERDPERRRLDMRVVVLPDQNHVGIARAYREKVIGEKNHVLLRRKIRERPQVEALIGAAEIDIAPQHRPFPKLDVGAVENFVKLLQDRCGIDRALLFTHKSDTEAIVRAGLPSGFVHGVKVTHRLPSNVGAILRLGFASEALKDDTDITPPVSRWDDMDARLKLLNPIRDQGSLVGIVGWADWAATSTDFARGSYSAYSMPFNAWVPLQCVVYHDCLCYTSPISLDKGDRYGTFLGALICLILPTYWLSSVVTDITDEIVNTVERTYTVLSYLHRFCWASFLTSHEFLTPDFTAQEARYSNGAHVIINISETESFENELVSLPPLGFYASCKEMTAHDAYRVGAETFATRAWRIARSRDGKPLGESGDVFRQEFPVEPGDA